jgi:hypothetical protein
MLYCSPHECPLQRQGDLRTELLMLNEEKTNVRLKIDEFFETENSLKTGDFQRWDPNRHRALYSFIGYLSDSFSRVVLHVLHSEGYV